MKVEAKITQVPHRAAIYARVSKPEQANPGAVSIDTQIEGCKQCLREMGYPEVLPEHIFIDTHTGEELYERPQLTALREVAKTFVFDLVMSYVSDRLSRQPVHRIIIRTELDHSGVKTQYAKETLEDTREGYLLDYVRGYAATIENESRVERTQRGKRERARRGELIYSNRPLYGYRFNTDKTALLPDPETSLVIVRIFTEVASGTPVRAIARKLEEDGVPTPLGRSTHWHYTVVRNLLKKSGYWGKHTVFKTRSVKLRPEERPHYKYRTRRITVDDSEAVVLPDSIVPALVSEDLAMQAHARMKANQQLSERNGHHPTLLRSGFLRCGYCGRVMGVRPPRDRKRGEHVHHSPPYYICQRATKNNGGCRTHTIFTPIADEWVWEKIRLVILNEQIIEDEVKRMEESEDPGQSILEAIDSQIAMANRKIAGLARTASYTEDEDASQALADEMAKVSKHKKDLETERAKAAAHYQDILEARAGLKQLFQWRGMIAERLDAMTLKEKRDVLMALNVQVKAYGKEHDPRLELHIDLPLSGSMPIKEDEDGAICVFTPVGVIPIGHPAPDVRSGSLKRGRTPDAEYIHHEGW